MLPEIPEEHSLALAKVKEKNDLEAYKKVFSSLPDKSARAWELHDEIETAINDILLLIDMGDKGAPLDLKLSLVSLLPPTLNSISAFHLGYRILPDSGWTREQMIKGTNNLTETSQYLGFYISCLAESIETNAK